MGIEGFGVLELKLKINNFRTTYIQEVKKITESTKSGASSDDIYEPSIWWFQLVDAFLRPHVTQWKMQSNLELKQRNTGGEPERSQSLEDCTTEAGNVEQINTEINSPIDTDNEPLQTNDQQPSNFHANVLESSDSHGDKRENNVTSKENQELKRKRVKNTSSLKAREMNIDSVINRLESVVTLASNARQQDLFDVFGRYVSDQLKQLPRRQAILTQSKIQNLLIQEFLDYEDARNNASISEIQCPLQTSTPVSSTSEATNDHPTIPSAPSHSCNSNYEYAENTMYHLTELLYDDTFK